MCSFHVLTVKQFEVVVFTKDAHHKMLLKLTIEHFLSYWDSPSKWTTDPTSSSESRKIWCQFHQRFTSSFWEHRSWRRKKDKSSCQSLFALMGSGCVKPARRTLMKLNPGKRQKLSHSHALPASLRNGNRVIFKAIFQKELFWHSPSSGQR